MTKINRSEYHKQYRLKNSEKIKEYRVKNSEKLKQYRLKNSEKLKQYHKEHYLKNRESKLQYNKNYIKNRYKTDINYRLSCNLRNRLSKAIKRNQKTGSSVSDLGCTIDQLKSYLENKFQHGMTWTNYGEWHIDHIVPLSSFDLTDREQLCKACHYTNLQPLWKLDNIIKSNKIND